MPRITHKKTSSRPKPHASAPTSATTRPWRRSPLLVALLVGVGVGAAAAIVFSGGKNNPKECPEGMVLVPGGTFVMGTDENRFLDCGDGTCGVNDALPLHTVEVPSFFMDKTPVTNAQFARFVQDTGIVTVAEQVRNGERLGSFVFRPPAGLTDLKNHRRWWVEEPQADWRHPDGPRSSIEGRDDHPVVHVCWHDAAAYAEWAGKRLPTEAEFEYAARGGLQQKRYAWGEELCPNGTWMTNIWQGKFPHENTEADGYRTTSPAASFPANGYGLFDMSGNVWQWCADWYRPDYYAHSPPLNPQGPSSSDDPNEPGREKRVQRGGSYLCSDTYCKGYLVGTRGKGEHYSSAAHIGFRCVRSAE